MTFSRSQKLGLRYPFFEISIRIAWYFPLKVLDSVVKALDFPSKNYDFSTKSQDFSMGNQDFA